jgi:nitroreductase
METLDVIQQRCSLKGHFSGREIEEEKINIILEAARVAPSARNTQPWRFIVVRRKDLVQELVTAAFSEVNQSAAAAPVIIVLCARPGDDISRDGKDYYLFDGGLAMENLLLAATDLGLATHPMTGVSEADVKKVLQIPDDVRMVALTPVAYPAEDSYEAAAKERLSQRTRKDLKEMVYYDKWAESEPA